MDEKLRWDVHALNMANKLICCKDKCMAPFIQ